MTFNKERVLLYFNHMSKFDVYTSIFKKVQRHQNGYKIQRLKTLASKQVRLQTAMLRTMNKL